MLELSNVQKIDFSSLYSEQKKLSSFDIKTEADWDEKADFMNDRVFKSIYIKQFCDEVKIDGFKTLLDVGSGPGTLGISLAPKFEQVYCLDFSSKMLHCVEQNAKNRNLTNVKTIKKSLEESWDDVPFCDILVASRCMEVKDLGETLSKLNKKAKRVYITYKVGGSFVDEDILNALERSVVPKPDFIYLIDILYNMGFLPTVKYIDSEHTKFIAKNSEDFIQKIEWSLGELGDEEKLKLEKLYNTEYKNKTNSSSLSKWALISYDTGL